MDLPFLEYAFRSQDRRGNGECSFEDFADAVIQMRNTEVGPVVSFLRLQMAEVLDEVSTLSDQIQAVGRDISSHISQVGEQAAHKISTIPRHAPPQQPPPDNATTLFGGSWWTTLGAGDHDEGDFDYFDQGNPNNHRAPYLPQQVNMFDDEHSPHKNQSDLGVMLQRAYNEPFPLDLPNLNDAQHRFAELCERTETQLLRLESLCHDRPLAPARKELFVCGTRLLTNLSSVMPRLLDGSTAPLPPPPGYPPLPPPSASRQQLRQKRQQQARVGWDGSDAGSPGSRKQHRSKDRETGKSKHDNHDEDGWDSSPQDFTLVSTEPLPPLPARLAELRAKNDLPPSSNGRDKNKKQKKGSRVHLDV